MVLSDHDIKIELASGRIVLEPFDEHLIQPASIDVRLGRDFRVFRNSSHVFIDPQTHQPDLTEQIVVGADDAFVLHPGQFALGTTLERIAVPDDVLGKLEGKSSLGRLGLMIHSTAGYIDPGWDGQITLELSNVASLPILLRPGMRIGQISCDKNLMRFHFTQQIAHNLYIRFADRILLNLSGFIERQIQEVYPIQRNAAVRTGQTGLTTPDQSFYRQNIPCIQITGFLLGQEFPDFCILLIDHLILALVEELIETINEMQESDHFLIAHGYIS